MTRYWFEFKKSKIKDLPPGLIMGCGITAHDFNEAITILEQKIFQGQEIPQLTTKRKNIDLRTLDQEHVWFPSGYE